MYGNAMIRPEELSTPPHKLTRQELLEALPSKVIRLLELHPVPAFRGKFGRKAQEYKDDVRVILALLEAT